MGHQLAPAPSPGPGAYAEKPETFAEEVARAFGGANARRSTENRPRSTRAGVPLSAFGPVDPEKKKPFLNAAARFGDDSTFVPGPGAYVIPPLAADPSTTPAAASAPCFSFAAQVAWP